MIRVSWTGHRDQQRLQDGSTAVRRWAVKRKSRAWPLRSDSSQPFIPRSIRPTVVRPASSDWPLS
jgi:hypothetical protein